MIRRALLLALLPHTARAHSELRRSSPASGEVLAAAPLFMELVFNERVQLTAFRLHRGGAEIALPPRGPIREAGTVRIALPPLPPGDYAAEWRAISADGHPVGGRIVFRIAP